MGEHTLIFSLKKLAVIVGFWFVHVTNITNREVISVKIHGQSD
jgi:hypothetical protein